MILKTVTDKKYSIVEGEKLTYKDIKPLYNNLCKCAKKGFTRYYVRLYMQYQFVKNGRVMDSEMFPGYIDNGCIYIWYPWDGKYIKLSKLKNINLIYVKMEIGGIFKEVRIMF